MRLISFMLALAIPGALLAGPPAPPRFITADERKACEYLGPITIGSVWAWHSSKGAMKGAFRKVQQMGGDSLFVVGQNGDFWTGSAVNGEAYRCAAKERVQP